MKTRGRIGALILVALVAMIAHGCSGGGEDGATLPQDGFAFYLNFSEPMDTGFPEGSVTATADPGRHIILWNVDRTVPFNFMQWISSTRMLVSFGTVPSSTTTVFGSLNPYGNPNGFRTAGGQQLPVTDFQAPNSGPGTVGEVTIHVRF